MSVAIIGAGFSGLLAAYLLKKKGVKVTVYEKDLMVGGHCHTLSTGESLVELGTVFSFNASIKELLKELKDKVNTSSIVITDDLGVVADVCSRIVVMYGGLIMEEGSAEEIFYNPMHPYTMGLLKSIPRLDLGHKQRLIPIPGSPPDLIKPPLGCPFAARCPYTMKICMENLPEYYESTPGHRAMCWVHHKDAPKVQLETGVRRVEL